MKKYCILLFLCVGIGVVAQELKIENLKWLPRPLHGSVKTVDGIIKCNLATQNGKTQKGGLWQIGMLKDKVNLKGYKYISFSARSVDEKHRLIYFYLRRRLAPGNEASYYSIIEIIPKWKTYYLPLRHGPNAAVTFRFAKGSKNCDIGLHKGGQLLYIQLAAKSFADLEFKDIKLVKIKKNDNLDIKKIVTQIKKHPKFIPYRFKQIIKPDAVKIAGFKIMIRPEAGKTEQFAAKELAKYLQKTTGAKFPIVNSAPKTGVIRLSVKPDKPAEGFSSELQDGKNLTIRGNSPRALVFAVYDFLEKAAGIRWFAPFKYGEVIPLNPNLKLPLFKDESAPVMSYRRPHYCSNKHTVDAVKHCWKMADWAFKNRFNVELERLKNRSKIQKFYDVRGSCIRLLEYPGHNFHKLIPPKRYFKSNPEFFCFDNATKKWRAKRAQLCTTNPKLITELGKIADAYFERNPDHKNFPLFQEDGSRLWCQCPPCLALNPSGSNLGSASENNINLANLVCAEIRKKHPNKGVFTYAYHGTARPPVKVLPQSGVRVSYCYAGSSPRQMPWESNNSQDILRWSKLTNGNIVIYSYHYLNPRYVYNDEKVLINMFRFFNILNIQGSNQETAESWGGIDGYLLYLGARLAWNPWFNEKAFKDDYFQKLYGHSAKPMRQFHDLLSKTLCDKSKWLRYGFARYPAIPKDELNQMAALIGKAKKAAGNNTRIMNAVEAQAAYLEYLKSYSKAMQTGDAYYREPTVITYQAAITAVHELQKVIKKNTPSRVVSLYVIRICKSWIRGLNTSWQEHQTFQKLSSQFNILKTLNPWKFKTDPKAVGDQKRWFALNFDDSKWKMIKSGNFWEKQGFSKYDGAGWYRVKINIPKSKQALGLYFGGADERTWVYLDGKYIGGHHEGDVGKLWNEPFSVMLPSGIKPGIHQLTVKVIDSAGGGGLWKNVFLISKK